MQFAGGGGITAQHINNSAIIATHTAHETNFTHQVTTSLDEKDAIKCPTCGCENPQCSQCYTFKDGKYNVTCDYGYLINDKGNFVDANGKEVEPSAKVKATDLKNQLHSVCPYDLGKQHWLSSTMGVVISIADDVLLYVLIILGTVGSIFVIVLGVQFAKAESAEKRDESKKRMIGAIIGLICTLMLLILCKTFTANAEQIVRWIKTV